MSERYRSNRNCSANQMIKPWFMAVVMIGGTASSANGASEVSVDSVPVQKELSEVVVVASGAIYAGSKIFYYPEKSLREAAGGSVQLLAGLQIPQLIVNPATGDISLSGGRRLAIRINGRPADAKDLASIASGDITKVEYDSDPAARYGNVDAVLEISVRRRESGYGAFFNVLQSANRGWGNYTGSLKYRSGRSEWSVGYTSNPMWNMDCYRDNSEWYMLEDGSRISRTESGIKTPNRMVTHRASAGYSYSFGNRFHVELQTRLIRRNDKYVSKGEIWTCMDNTSLSGLEQEMSFIEGWQGDVDMYLYYRPDSDNRIYMNVVPSVSYASSSRSYESPETAFDTSVSTRGFNLLSEIVWERRIGSGTISSGGRCGTGHAHAAYEGGYDAVKEGDTGITLFAEWKQSLGPVRYTAGLGFTYHTVRNPIRSRSVHINPKLSAAYSPFKWGTLLLSFVSKTVSPTVNELNPESQPVDMYQWSKGNPGLHSYCRYESKLSFEGSFRDIMAGIGVTDVYCHDPVMDAKQYEEGHIVRSWYNVGYNNDVKVAGYLRMPLFIPQLSVSLEGGWHSGISKGLDYRHVWSQPFVNAQLMFMSGAWWVMAKYNSAYNMLWGEMVTTVDNNLLNFGVGYTWRCATFMAGIVNPTGNVAVRTKDLGVKAGYDRTYQASGSNRLVWVGVTLNLYKGSKKAMHVRKLENKHMYETIKNQMK